MNAICFGLAFAFNNFDSNHFDFFWTGQLAENHEYQNSEAIFFRII
jgi:hypothetical protein